MIPRGDIVFTALCEFYWQKKDSHGNPIPPNPAKYWEALSLKAPFPKSWCGAFVGYSIAQNGGDLVWVPTQGLRPAPKQIDKRAGLPGDIAWFVKNQHYALIEEIDATGYLTVEGNQPAILRKHRTFESIHSVYSIERYLNV